MQDPSQRIAMLVTKELCPRSFVRCTNSQALRRVGYVTLLSAALCLAASAPTRAQVSGQNVNMVSGTNWTNGDPFLQRQNEPSIAVSSRNPSHLLAGADGKVRCFLDSRWMGPVRDWLLPSMAFKRPPIRLCVRAQMDSSTIRVLRTIAARSP